MTLYPGFAELYHEALPPHIRRYLNARGIPDPVIERAQLGWNGERITIPVYDREDRLVFYKLGKSPEDRADSPKMLYDPPGVTAELYGWDTLRILPPFVIVCEGEYDRLVLEARGFPAVTGTSGAAVFKKDWAEAIAKIPFIYICYDNDAAGRAGARRVTHLTPHARIVTLPPEVGEGGDVTDFFVRLKRSREDFVTLLKESTPLPPPGTPRPHHAHRTEPQLAKSDIARLKAAVRIEDIIRQYVVLRPSGKALMGRCCFHEDRNPSLAVFPKTQSFYCFGCQRGGDVISFLMAAEHLTFTEAVNVLKRYAHQP